MNPEAAEAVFATSERRPARRSRHAVSVGLEAEIARLQFQIGELRNRNTDLQARSGQPSPRLGQEVDKLRCQLEELTRRNEELQREMAEATMQAEMQRKRIPQFIRGRSVDLTVLRPSDAPPARPRRSTVFHDCIPATSQSDIPSEAGDDDDCLDLSDLRRG
mmetsp:Transcript_32433/g.93049  ORF Transcript_32433/g.93049 Transcript_32433/m.93049 type:complete len:162 (-) Transcript_32433:82-567(-)